MESWKKYFDNKETQLNEDHKKGKEDQAKFICETIGKMNAYEVKEVYDFIESETWKEK